MISLLPSISVHPAPYCLHFCCCLPVPPPTANIKEAKNGKKERTGGGGCIDKRMLEGGRRRRISMRILTEAVVEGAQGWERGAGPSVRFNLHEIEERGEKKKTRL